MSAWIPGLMTEISMDVSQIRSTSATHPTAIVSYLITYSIQYLLHAYFTSSLVFNNSVQDTSYSTRFLGFVFKSSTNHFLPAFMHLQWNMVFIFNWRSHTFLLSYKIHNLEVFNILVSKLYYTIITTSDDTIEKSFPSRVLQNFDPKNIPTGKMFLHNKISNWSKNGIF